MNIGEAAREAGMSAKRVRHYESIGLVGRATRTQANYRSYTESDVHTLRFIQRARTLGFSIEDVRLLLGLWKDRRRPSREVKRLVERHAQDLKQRIAAMAGMLAALEHLAAHCHGDARPDCPILHDLEGGNSARRTLSPNGNKRGC